MTDTDLVARARVDYKQVPDYLASLKVFKKIAAIVGNADVIEEHLTHLGPAEENMKGALGKQLRKASFLEPCILVPYLASSASFDINILREGMRRTGVGSDAKRKTKRTPEETPRAATLRIMADVIRGIALNTENVAELRKVYVSGQGDPESTEFWTQGTFIEAIVSSIDNWAGEPSELDSSSWTRYTRAVIAHSLGMSERNVGPYVNSRLLASTNMRRLIFGLMLQALFLKTFGDDFIPLGIDPTDAIPGESGINRYFDGVLRLGVPGRQQDLHLVKLANLSLADIEIICTSGVSLQDIRRRIEPVFDGPPGAVIFVAGYPSSDSLERELYWRREGHVDLSLLFLVDFFEIFRLWEDKPQNDRVRRFLIEKLK